jgi:UDP-N-acetylglucosamine 2-epimerase (non-hydrolysing)
MDALLAEKPLDCLLVQGDTTTALAASLASFYHKIPVAHVEAGLRSGDIFQPWPEEANRRLTAVMAQLHFAPTGLARDHLLAEGVSTKDVVVTGNTIVDSVEHLLQLQAIDYPLPEGVPDDGSRLILVTSHRRESWGAELENICNSILELVETYPQIRVVYPVHLNPNVSATVGALLASRERIHLVPPVDYFQFLSLLRRCYIVLTDSGGVQEEAPIFHKPVLVLRKITERPEASLMGMAKVVGTSCEVIVREASRLLSSDFAYQTMAAGDCPYGDGQAAARITMALSRWLAGEDPLLDHFEQFQGAGSKEQVAA